MSSRIRVADFIARTLADRGLRHVFLVTGGGAMHLNDAFGRERRLELVPCHHEQACAMAAESYARMTGRMAAVNVTTGPGGTNAITGVWGAWVDSLPMIVVSGQVKWETVVRSTGLPLRQLGDQEIDIAALVRPITKYAELVRDPATIRFHLERALHLATAGRPGPTWIDVPMDVQGALVEPEALGGYDPALDAPRWSTPDLRAAARQVAERFAAAERPVVLPGGGVRIAGAEEEFAEVIARLGAPVATAFNAHDLLWDDHPLNAGRPGTIGDRAGNFAVQNSDALLVLGCRLNIRQISYGYRNFARAAFTAMVDADEAELKKPTLRIDLPIHADLKAFLRALLDELPPGGRDRHRAWVDWCLERRRRYPVVLPEYRAAGASQAGRGAGQQRMNPYVFMDALFAALPEGAKVVTGDGTACVVAFQAARLKRGMRLYSNSGSAPMGYDLPAAVGASIGLGRAPVICLAGDGSLQMNLQELQTIRTQRLPVKIFVLNNEGYHSIRQTQQNYFPDNPVGYDARSGVEFPDLEKLAGAYGFPFVRIAATTELDAKLPGVIAAGGAVLCEVLLDPDQPFAPKTSSRRLDDGRMVSAPLEDMAPFLPRDELAESVLIPPPER